MRLIQRHRSPRPKAPRIPISEEEIAADLHYPVTRRAAGKPFPAITDGGRR